MDTISGISVVTVARWFAAKNLATRTPPFPDEERGNVEAVTRHMLDAHERCNRDHAAADVDITEEVEDWLDDLRGDRSTIRMAVARLKNDFGLPVDIDIDD